MTPPVAVVVEDTVDDEEDPIDLLNCLDSLAATAEFGAKSLLEVTGKDGGVVPVEVGISLVSWSNEPSPKDSFSFSSSSSSLLLPLPPFNLAVTLTTFFNVECC